MRRVPLLLIALASSTAAQPTPQLKPPSPIDYTQPVEDENPPAPVIKTASNVPAELTAAKPWIARRYMSGAVRGRAAHETFTLQRVGGQALITHEVRVPQRWMREHGLNSRVLAWRLESSTQYLGTIDEKIKIAAANGTQQLELSCKKTKVAAARPDAVRGRTPKFIDEECGDTGRWVPGSTKQVSVILCEEDADSWDKLAFAPAPGVEWVHVNDDCVIQGGGWRQVAKDLAIKHPRQRDQLAPPSKKAPGKAAPRN